MAEYFDIIMFKKSRNDKAYSVKLGSATKRDDGGFYLNFDAVPFGAGDVVVMPRKEKGERAGKSVPDADDSDRIPF